MDDTRPAAAEPAPDAPDAAPPRRGRGRLVPVIIAALVLGGLLAGFETWRLLTPAAGVATAPRIVEIPARLGLAPIAGLLEEAGVIRSRLGFMLLAVVHGRARSLKAGEYEIPAGATTPAVLALIESGRVRRHLVLFREGSTVAELGRDLETEGLARADEVRRLARDARFLRALDIDAPSLEGYLFPDSYQFVKGLTGEELLGRMVARMREHLGPDILAEARARNLSPHALLTLASIIEREAVDPQEMPLISAVFWNRLRLDMPLQADPTVQYAVGRERARLSREDLSVDSPYNTYRRSGLPPGPIASPGRAAIQAALNPAKVSYLYFVSIDDRRHHFSTTLDDHNAAVTRYRRERPRP
ncbi:MAG: endolytic transglycosylase MltG [Candidatus Rokubacteria bacterium]|nr:endolytic transglycosylase MltG [Candidatus Rokubacteria bacterium]